MARVWGEVVGGRGVGGVEDFGHSENRYTTCMWPCAVHVGRVLLYLCYCVNYNQLHFPIGWVRWRVN